MASCARSLLVPLSRHAAAALSSARADLLRKGAMPTLQHIRRYQQKRRTGTAALQRQQQKQTQLSVVTALPTGAQTVKVIFSDDEACEVNYIWLRDNCNCSHCIHPDSKQKLVDTAGLDYNVRPVSMEVSPDGSLEVTWGDSKGTHHSSYNPLWLYRNARSYMMNADADENHCPLPPMVFWDRVSIWKSFPEVAYKEFMDTDDGLYRWLDCMHKYGVVLLRGLQMLHCLKAMDSKEDVGGKSFFVDGFMVANWMREHSPAAFHILSSTPVQFSIFSHKMRYSQTRPVICVNKDGNVCEIHYNNRTLAPVQVAPHLVAPFYHALKEFAMKMRDANSELSFNMAPGDLVAFNNRRVLHGRTSFDPTKVTRHLEGCYADIDEVFTKYRAMHSTKP
ncbi:gamma-butyrobetaine dioxygenase-like isoform X5 [Dermacentor andersoni]|uniref:gamma-butyrobetaine dioxygenase-like isoform X5 n=1 Tax=Dermacentor andersoni TaxID=34620 RepID=UPI00241736E1|nr:gamma-butyrobetaine dioxygenase-like isoform X5 [Dermacentor andersoni]